MLLLLLAASGTVPTRSIPRVPSSAHRPLLPAAVTLRSGDESSSGAALTGELSAVQQPFAGTAVLPHVLLGGAVLLACAWPSFASGNPECAVSVPTAALAANTAGAAPPLNDILAKAGRRALGGGVSGAIAGVAQVILLMWLRTTMNYQYRYGTSTKEALSTLYAEGGVSRFYQGLP